MQRDFTADHPNELWVADFSGCALLALIASLTTYPPASVPVLMLGLAFGLRAR